MKYLTKKNLFLLCLSLMMMACSKNNIDEVVAEDPGFEPEEIIVNNLVTALKSNNDDALNLNCVTINYPFELVLESGISAEINSKAQYEDAISSDASDRVVDYVFPINITDADGNIQQVENNTELGIQFGSCIPTTGWQGFTSNGEFFPVFLFQYSTCLDIVFPVNLIDEDSTTYTANNEQELIDLMVSANDLLLFALPMTVELPDETEQVVATTSELLDLLVDCEDIDTPVCDTISVTDFECHTIIFPIDVNTPDGVVTLNNEDEYATLLLSGTEIEFLFPFSLQDEDGNIYEVSEVDDLIAVYLVCGIIINVTPADVCATPAHALIMFNQQSGLIGCGYTVDFPYQAVAEGVTYDIENSDDYFELYNLYLFEIDKIELVYPMTVTLTNGTTLTFNSDQEICDFIDEC